MHRLQRIRAINFNNKKVHDKINNKYTMLKKMNNDVMIKELRRCGLSTFVKYYQELLNLNVSNQELAHSLTKKEGYTHNSALTKIASARRIIKSSKGQIALIYISNRRGKYITSKLKNKAKILIK